MGFMLDSILQLQIFGDTSCLNFNKIHINCFFIIKMVTKSMHIFKNQTMSHKIHQN